MKPRIVGFTIARNAQRYDYPLIESIQSILPICDQFVVSVGNSTDQTLEWVKSIPSDKITIIHSVWDDTCQQGGRVLALETDKAFDVIDESADWVFYLQADEVVHEKYLPVIIEAVTQYHHDPEIEGFLFSYKHFYGSYQYIGTSRRWYRREIRLFRNNKKIRAYRDAQGFRLDNRKLRVKLIDAEIYHYGWVKDPRVMGIKHQEVYRLWSLPSEESIQPESPSGPVVCQPYAYDQIDQLALFTGTHPKIMQPRVDRMNWRFEWHSGLNRMKPTYRLLHFIEKWTGKRLFEYRNYKMVHK